MTTLASTVPERRILDDHRAASAPCRADALETLAAAADGPDGRAQRGAVPRGRPVASELFGIVERAHRDRHPVARRARVGGRGARARAALFGELGLFDDGPRSADARALEETERRRARVRRRARACSTRTPSCCGSSCASSPGGCATPTRRSPTRCSSTSRPHRQAPARARRRRRRVPAADDPGGARRAGRRVAASGSTRRSRCSSGSAGSRSTGRSRYRILDREALHEPRDPARPTARSVGRRRNASTRRQASAASSARCAGRSGAWTKPWSASG